MFSAQTTGLRSLQKSLAGLGLAASRERDWWVGSSYYIARFIEFGTAKMGARPFFRPAIQAVRGIQMGPSVGVRSEQLYAELFGPLGVTGHIAMQLLEEVQHIIDQKGLVLTGEMRASFAAAPGSKQAMEKKSKKQRVEAGYA